MYYVPAEWLLGGLAEGWCFGMFITAGRCSRPHSGSSPEDLRRRSGLDDSGGPNHGTGHRWFGCRDHIRCVLII